MKNMLFLVGLLIISPATAQTSEVNSLPASVSSPKNGGGSFEFSASPSFGESVLKDSASTLIDDSEYEANFSRWQTLDANGALKVQLKVGVTYSPNYFDGDEPESGFYGEAQLGDIYIPLRNFVRGNFSKAADVDNAVRPYARYRYTFVHRNFLAAHVRDDQQATLGLRYRQVPYVMQNSHETPGMYLEARLELNRIWSTDSAEELWNPKAQFELYSKPMWHSVRLLGRATFEANLYQHVLASPDTRRSDWRLRLTGGVDVSDLLSKGLGIKGLSVEILGRYQRRWSNVADARHSRAYFVPSVSFSVPY